MPHVLVAGYGSVHPRGLAVLESRSDITYEEIPNPDDEQFMARLPQAEALLIRTAPLPPEAVKAAERLRIVSRHGVGYDNIPVDVLNEKGIPLAIIDNVNALTVAEHTLFLMLAVAKRAIVNDQAIRNGDWGIRDRITSHELYGKTLLILGFGRIGQNVARRAAAFGMRVLAFDPNLSAEQMQAAGAEKADDWRSGLGEVDFISLHVPRTPDTENCIAARELTAMKTTAVIVNTARGGLIDENALCSALRSGQIGGAGLDTFDAEPLPSDHPLLALDNVVLSPHSAALTEECLVRMGQSAAENVLAGLDGCLNPKSVVNSDALRLA